jgi:hypothetical protein
MVTHHTLHQQGRAGKLQVAIHFGQHTVLQGIAGVGMLGILGPQWLMMGFEWNLESYSL